MTYRLARHDRTTIKRKPRFKPLAVLGLFISGLTMSLSMGIVQATSDTTTPVTPNVMITGVQTGGCSTNDSACTESPAMEYVELYNPSATDLQVSGWKLRYLSSSGSTVTDLASITGTLSSHRYVFIAHAAFYDGLTDMTFGSASDTGKLAKSGGHVEIVDSSGNTVDRVGWGSAEKPLVKAAPAPVAGKALQRKADETGQLVFSANNFQDFAVIDAPTPQHGGFAALEPTPTTPEPTAPTPTNPIPATPTPTTPTCEGVIINELMPNPAGTDSGHEFIELHNPTNEVISLDGCSLQSSASSTKTYGFSQISLQPGEYHSFNDTETGITLPNSAGGTVWLLSPAEELQAVTYPADMEDDTVWALNGGAWALSYSATPGAANVATPVKPCDDPAQVRNTDTGRCGTPDSDAPSPASSALAASASGLTPCKAGQERNPETNRCRNVTSANATNSLTPCKEGQERNPETNRCKAVGNTSGTATPCPAGQERNPETNRCKKILASPTNGGLNDVKDVAAAGAQAAKPHKPYWLVGVFVAVVAVGYAIYEWRQEIGQFFSRRFTKAKLAPVR